VAYHVKVKDTAAKQLAALPEGIRKAVAAMIDKLQVNPFLSGTKKLRNVTNVRSARVGDHRIVYSKPNNRREFWIMRVEDRKTVYRNLRALVIPGA
jgi:mRNA interferase RelE/StbE